LRQPNGIGDERRNGDCEGDARSFDRRDFDAARDPHESSRLATLTINNAGDAFYQSGSQQVRVVEPRQRSARQ
jgi:hypothetical protein